MPLKILIAGLLASLLCGCAAFAPDGAAGPAAAPVDLKRLEGRWYVQARTRRFIEAEEPGAFVEYAREGAEIGERRFARTGGLDAEPHPLDALRWEVDPAQPGHWREAGWWPLARDEVLVLYVDAHYRHALLGAPDRSQARILSREPLVPEWVYAGLLARLSRMGYDVSDLRRILHSPDQQGLPGFR